MHDVKSLNETNTKKKQFLIYIFLPDNLSFSELWLAANRLPCHSKDKTIQAAFIEG